MSFVEVDADADVNADLGLVEDVLVVVEDVNSCISSLKAFRKSFRISKIFWL